MKSRRATALFTATLAMTGTVWAWWLIDPTAPRGPVLPAILSAALAANVALTLASPRLKRAVVAPVQRYLINPPVRLLLRLGLMPFGYALLETRGRVTGLPRATPVGNGLQGTTFWVIAEHGLQAGYVRNIQRCPHVRVKLRRGWRFVWVHGTAQVLPDDDPYARQRRLSRWHPLRAMNLAVVRIMGTNLLTIRIDLHTGEPQNTPPEDSGRCADQRTAQPVLTSPSPSLAGSSARAGSPASLTPTGSPSASLAWGGARAAGRNR